MTKLVRERGCCTAMVCCTCVVRLEATGFWPIGVKLEYDAKRAGG